MLIIHIWPETDWMDFKPPAARWISDSDCISYLWTVQVLSSVVDTSRKSDFWSDSLLRNMEYLWQCLFFSPRRMERRRKRRYFTRSQSFLLKYIWACYLLWVAWFASHRSRLRFLCCNCRWQARWGGRGGECNILLAVHRTRRRALPEGDCNAATILLLPLPLVIARSPRNYNNVPASDSTTWGRLNLCGWVDEWMAGFEKEKMEVI